MDKTKDNNDKWTRRHTVNVERDHSERWVESSCDLSEDMWATCINYCGKCPRKMTLMPTVSVVLDPQKAQPPSLRSPHIQFNALCIENVEVSTSVPDKLCRRYRYISFQSRNILHTHANRTLRNFRWVRNGAPTRILIRRFLVRVRTRHPISSVRLFYQPEKQSCFRIPSGRANTTDSK